MEENITNAGFSVLMSVYKKENSAFLKLALKSIWNDQVLKPNEIVIVKDGPLTDELNEALEAFSKEKPVKLIQLDKNYGLGIALNKGLQECTYDIVARMDSDDISKPNRFKTQLAKFKEDPELDVIGAAIDEFESDIDQVKATRRLPEGGPELYRLATKRNPMNHPVVMFRKEAVLAVGGYKHFPLFEDYYLWARMMVNGSKFYNCPESLLYFRFSTNTYNRRAGLSYALTELKLEKEFFKMGLLKWWDFLTNVPLKFGIRISPKFFRIYLYKQFLR